MNIYKQLEQITEDLDLRKPLYYYDNGWQISVCLLINKSGEPIARGISICSPFDNYDKPTGRFLALGRALKAIRKRDTTGEINPSRFDEHRSFYPRRKEDEAATRLSVAYEDFRFKSTYFPNLTEFEARLLGGDEPKTVFACINREYKRPDLVIFSNVQRQNS